MKPTLRDIPYFLACILAMASGWTGLPNPVEASCGSASCFVVVNSQSSGSPKGTLTVNGIYTYVPQGTLLSGTTGIIPAVETDSRELILGDHKEKRTISQQYTLDLNYGLTDSITLELTMPYKVMLHRHIQDIGREGPNGEGVPTLFTDNGLGDMILTTKYTYLPTIRNLLVPGFGIQLPTGKFHGKINGTDETQEPGIQLGRGNVALLASLYQSYEIIPHRLNQFSSIGYRHTFRNNLGYQFGDQYTASVGLNFRAFEWLVLNGQFNYRLVSHDNFSSSLSRAPTPSDPEFGTEEAVVIDPTIKDRRVPTTGSTILMFSPGFSVNAWQGISFYFNAQIPMVRDFNGNLAQGVSYLFGFTKTFQVGSPF